MALAGGPYGITQTGFVAPSMAVILSAIESDLQAAFGAGIDLSAQSNFGQLAGTMADRILDLWNLGLADYTAQTSEGATGVAEDSVNGLTGCIREAATASTVELTLTGDNATVVAQGKTVAVTGQNPPQFDTDASATLTTATSWVHGTVYAVGDYVTNTTQAWAINTTYPAGAFAVANGNLYYTPGGGTSASSGGGPSGTGIGIVDNTVTWNYVSASLGASIYYCNTGGTAGAALTGGPSGVGMPAGSTIPDGSGSLTWLWVGAGAAMAQVAATATVTGTLNGPAGEVTVIVTPVSGWNGVWNVQAATMGAAVETDSAYRQRRDDTLGNEGKGYLNAIQASVAAVVAEYQGVAYPVTACTVFENTSDATGVSGAIAGMPPHSIEALVQGAPASPARAVTAWNLAVATAIFDTLPAGIQPFGQTNTVTVTVTDSEGNPQVVQFSQPGVVDVCIAMTVTVDPNSPQFNSSDGGKLTITNQLIAWLNGLGAGFDVTSAYASAQAFIANVGAWQISGVYVNTGTSPPVSGTEVTITSRQVAFTTAGAIGVTIVQTSHTD